MPSRSWDDAHLLHHTHVVVDHPPFGDPSVLYAEDVYAPHAQLLAGGRDAEYLIDVLEVVGMAHDDPIPLGDDVLDVGVALGEAREERAEPFLDVLSAVSLPESADAV